MSRFLSQNLVLIVMAAVLAGTAALSYATFKAALRDEEFRAKSAEEDLALLLQDISSDCRSIATVCRNDVLVILRNSSGGSPQDFEHLAFSSPMIRRVFVAGSDGRIIHPADDGHFNKHFFNLFYAPVRDPGSGVEGDGERKSGRPARAPFASEIEGKTEGWLPWFSENRLTPIAWARSAKNPNMVVGAEIETAALLSRMAARIPQRIPPHVGISLLDEHGSLVCSAGSPAAASGEDAGLSYEISPSLPNWKIKGRLDPLAMESGRAFHGVLSALALGAVIMLGVAWVFVVSRRDMLLAGQKTSFVANVSHELKTPLTNIRLFAEMLRNMKDLPAEKKERYLSVILSESERLSRLIANVLDFSRIEAGERKYREDSFLLAETIAETLEANKAALEEKGMRLECNLGEGFTVSCDRDAFAQALQNLVSNAVKYASSGAFLGISVRREQGRVMVAVADRGPGIPKSSRGKIFRKFYRCDDRLTAETRGTGLGLSIARRLMRDQGGDVIYEPAPDAGSVFTIIIPSRRDQNGREDQDTDSRG